MALGRPDHDHPTWSIRQASRLYQLDEVGALRPFLDGVDLLRHQAVGFAVHGGGGVGGGSLDQAEHPASRSSTQYRR